VVNLSLRISQAAVWALSTWPASHHRRLPGCHGMFSPRPGVRANHPSVLHYGELLHSERRQEGEEEYQRKMGRRKFCRNSTFSTKLPLPPQASASLPPPSFQNIHQTTHQCVCVSLLLFYMREPCLSFTKLLSVKM
jgi:hypothetical protein